MRQPKSDAPRAAEPSTTIRFDAARAFLVDAALPFWSSTGAYQNGCFVEHLDLKGRPVDPGFTRIRVQARQIYVFSHAQVAGFFDDEAFCARAEEFFLRSAWLGPRRGWAKRIDRFGVLKDATSDLYDIAFALFALAWRHRATKETRLLEIAHETLDFLDVQMRHPHGGFFNDAQNSQPRQQNPHMHLLEAMNAWFETSGDARFLRLAQELVGLFETRFYDARSGALGEFFNEDWSAADGLSGQIVEPGHQFEWAWILAHFSRLSGESRLDVVRSLTDAALRTGFDPETGLTIDQVDRSGAPLASSRRLWPQTEALKASLAGMEFLGDSAGPRIGKILDAICNRFLKPGPVAGSWIDHFDADWSPVVDKVPTSSLYHVALAFMELLRLQKLLESPALRAK